MLFAGELLSGLTFGAFTTVGLDPSLRPVGRDNADPVQSAIGYASEIAPVPLRAFLSSYIALVSLSAHAQMAGH